MMRRLIISALAAGCLASMPGSTLQRLSLTDMIQKSTLVVRGTVQKGTSAELRGSLIYTHYHLTVTAAFKGTPGSPVDIAVPGGVLNGMQQPVAGAPALTPGQDYIIFLWTSKTGLTQIIGLSQGLFTVTTSGGQPIVSRGASSSPMVDSAGQSVTDSNIQMPLSQLVSTIQAALAGGNGQ